MAVQKIIAQPKDVFVNIRLNKAMALKMAAISKVYGKDTTQTIEFCILMTHLVMTDVGVIEPVYNKAVESDVGVKTVKKITEKVLGQLEHNNENLIKYK